MMTRIEEDMVFVHASDIQLLDDATVDRILAWHPNILLASGPLSTLTDWMPPCATGPGETRSDWPKLWTP